MPFTRAVGGGSFISAALLAKGLCELGYDVCGLFPEEGPSTEVFRSYGIKVEVDRLFPVILPIRRDVASIVSFVKKNTSTFQKAVKYLQAGQFDLVHCNDDTSIVPWGLASRVARVKCVWHVRSGRRGATDPIRLKVADTVICISSYVTGRIPSRFKKAILYNPVDVKRFQPAPSKENARASLGLPGCELQLAQVGRDVSYKRPEWSVAVLNTLLRQGWDVRLIFLGQFDSCRQTELKRLLPRSYGRRVSFLGWVNDPEKYLASSDLLLHPANNEHFGRIFIEATACKVPFLATDSGAAPELVAEGALGWILDGAQSETSYAEYAARIVDVLKGQQKEKDANLLIESIGPLKVAKRFIELVDAREGFTDVGRS